VKLAALWLDDVVVIPGAKDNGAGEPRQPLREQAFEASDGWELDFDGYGGFRIWREGMAAPVIVGGYGYSYVRADGDMSLGLPKTETAPEVNTDVDGERILAAADLKPARRSRKR
jgi:hypothetical protein